MFFVGIGLGLLAGYLLVALLKRRKPQPIPTEIEFWVYLPTDKMPSQDDLMTDLSKAQALGPPELLLFSDIRLHIAVALRAKNLEYFRPDLTDPRVEPTAETLEALANATAMARVRFSSDLPIPDDRYLRLVPYLAYALAKRAGAKAILDVAGSRLMTVEELEQTLQGDRKLQSPGSHVNVIWQPLEAGGHAETRGFGKKGQPDLRTLPVRQDQRVLVVELLEEAVKQLWPLAKHPETVSIHAYDDEFNLLLGPPQAGVVPVRISRMHAI